MSEIPMFPDACPHRDLPERCWQCLTTRVMVLESALEEREVRTPLRCGTRVRMKDGRDAEVESTLVIYELSVGEWMTAGLFDVVEEDACPRGAPGAAVSAAEGSDSSATAPSVGSDGPGDASDVSRLPLTDAGVPQGGPFLTPMPNKIVGPSFNRWKMDEQAAREKARYERETDPVFAREQEIERYRQDERRKDTSSLRKLAADEVVRLCEVLAPLVVIADAYDANELDDEARKHWGRNYEHENSTPPGDIELYSGRGGRQLLTLEHCLRARAFERSSDLFRGARMHTILDALVGRVEKTAASEKPLKGELRCRCGFVQLVDDPPRYLMSCSGCGRGDLGLALTVPR